MKKSIWLRVWLILVIGGLAGCTKSLPIVPVSPTGTLKPPVSYKTPTATLPLPTITPLDRIPADPLPSATQFIYEVVKGDTMLGIALRYGVALDALQAANPTVDPQFLSVGTLLIIPLRGDIYVELPTPTPANIEAADPVCYRTIEGGVWGFLLVKNNLDVAVENLSAWLGLFSEDGVMVTSTIAVGLLNILRPGDAMPLIAFFHPPLPINLICRGELLTAVVIPETDDRYLGWQFAYLNVEIEAALRKEALVSGALDQPVGADLPGQFWIAAVAYDQDGRVIGARKIDATGELQFSMFVYTLGEQIERVDILTEVRR